MESESGLDPNCCSRPHSPDRPPKVLCQVLRHPPMTPAESHDRTGGQGCQVRAVISYFTWAESSSLTTSSYRFLPNVLKHSHRNNSPNHSPIAFVSLLSFHVDDSPALSLSALLRPPSLWFVSLLRPPPFSQRRYLMGTDLSNDVTLV